MQQQHWNALPDAAQTFFNDDPTAIPTKRSTFDTLRRGLLWHVPKALGAHYQLVGMLPTGSISQGYRCQEKLNGAYVCWDGAQLWSKTGGQINPPNSFVDYLPPGFPIVGELYVGNGHRERSFSATLASGKLPTVDTLGPAAVGVDPRVIWKHVRIVAFDVPGIVEDWPYAARHHLLCAVIAAWSKKRNDRVLRESPEDLPLQVIIQYPMQALPELFLEIIHGVAFQNRKHPPFGIPEFGDRRMLNTLKWNATRNPFIRVDYGVPGEGCMLWHQDERWHSRGRDGPTSSILKFKPLFLSTATVGSEGVEHSQHRQLLKRKLNETDAAAANLDGDLPGYHVQLHTHVSGELQTIKAFVSASYTIEGLRQKFRPGSRVFFVFFMFERLPMYPRAIGPVLSVDQAKRVQQWALQFGTIPRLDNLLAADKWERTACRALFPVDVKWEPNRYIKQAAMLLSQRLVPSQVVYVDGTVTTTPRQRRATDRDRPRRRDPGSWILDRLRVYFAHYFDRPPMTPFAVRDAWNTELKSITRYLLSLCFSLKDVEIFSDDLRAAYAAGRLVSAWGPFSIVDDERTTSAPVTSDLPLLVPWLHGMLRMSLGVIAGAFIRTEKVLRQLRDAMDPVEIMQQMEALLGDYVLHEAAPQWNKDAIVHLFIPARAARLEHGGLFMSEEEIIRGERRYRPTLESILARIYVQCGGGKDQDQSPTVFQTIISLSPRDMATNWGVAGNNLTGAAVDNLTALLKELKVSNWRSRRPVDIDDHLFLDADTFLPRPIDQASSSPPVMLVSPTPSVRDDARDLMYQLMSR